MRNALGQFVKGSKPIAGFKRGHKAWNKGQPFPQMIGNQNGFKKGHKMRLGIKHTEETKQKIRKAVLGRCLNSGRTHFMKGHESWNKGKKYLQIANEKHPMWKGDDVGYYGLHLWVKRHFGQPTKCEHCGKDGLMGRLIHWANVDHTYKRNLDDWIRLCVSCHQEYDLKNN